MFSKFFFGSVFICHRSWPLSLQFWMQIYLGGRCTFRLLGSRGCISGAKRTRLEGEINICFYLSNKDWLLYYPNCETLEPPKGLGAMNLWEKEPFLKLKHQVFL